jgi:sugar lactone lactonase YvrE
MCVLADVATAQGIITTVAGGGPGAGLGVDASIEPSVMAADGAGDLYILVTNQNRVLKLDVAGQLAVVAGAGGEATGSSAAQIGDGGLAVDASLDRPGGIAIDRTAHVLYIADTGNKRVRAVDLNTGTIDTVAGDGGSPGPIVVGQTATDASLHSPSRVAVTASGELLILDSGFNQVHKVDTNGTITTIAGQFAVFTHGGDGGPATSAGFQSATGLAVDALGNIFVSDTGSDRVRRVDAGTGTIQTIAGDGTGGFGGDGGPAVGALLNNPIDVAIGPGEHVLIADQSNHRIRRVDAGTGIITTIAGGGSSVPGDGGPASNASLNSPAGVGVDQAGLLLIASHGRVQRVSSAGVINTIAGTGEVTSYSGEGGAAVNATLDEPIAIALSPSGDLFISDIEAERIRKVDGATGAIHTFAGSDASGPGDGGPASSASLIAPFGLATDSNGNLYIAEYGRHRIRKVDAGTGIISTYAGTSFGFGGDGGSAAAAQLACPRGLGFDPLNNLYIADHCNNRIRRVDAATGVITTVAGTGETDFATFGGDGGPATSASIHGPEDVTVGPTGDIFIADSGHTRIRKVDIATGIITTLVGPTFPDTVGYVRGLVADQAGNLFAANYTGNRIFRIDTMTGAIAVVAGTGFSGFSGDGGPATLAKLNIAYDVAIDAAGNVLVADSRNRRIRNVSPLNRAPTSNAGFDLPGVLCSQPGRAPVALDGSQSSDPDGDTLEYTWTGPFVEGGGTVSGVNPTVTLPLGGPHTITLTVEDPSGASHSDTLSITVVDTQSPLLTLARSAIEVEPTTASGAHVDVIAASGATAVDVCHPTVDITHDAPAEFPIGTTTPVNITASDASDNAVSDVFSVTVCTGPKFVGFHSPLGGADATGGTAADPVRAFKLNSTIPIKMTLARCDGSPLTTGVHTIQVAKVTSTTTLETPIDATPTGAATTGNAFTLAGIDGTWQFNLSTKTMTAGIWQIRVTLADGALHTAFIEVK